MSAAVHRSAVASGYTTVTVPNGMSVACTRSGFLCSRKPRSVAGLWVVERVSSIGPPQRGAIRMTDKRRGRFCDSASAVGDRRVDGAPQVVAVAGGEHVGCELRGKRRVLD